MSEAQALPTVSIVIPAYNHARYLDEAIDSVLSQTYPSVQLIVIDDGSTDSTPQVLARRGKAVNWLRQDNRGQAATLERGWAMAAGEWLGYLSADDRLEPEAVASLLGCARARPELIAVYPDFTLLDPQSRPVRTVQAPDFDYTRMLERVECPIGPGALFRREAYLAAGPWNGRYRQMPDYDFWLRIGLVGPIARLPQCLAAFRVHEGSQTFSAVSAARADEPVRIVRAVLDHPRLAALGPDARARAIASAELVSAQLHARAGRLGEAWRCGMRALRRARGHVGTARVLRLMINAVANRFGHRLLWQLRSLLGHRRA